MPKPLSKAELRRLVFARALACQSCNNHKHIKVKARDPVTRQWVALLHPRQHRWVEHLAWSDDYLEILGLTPTGRATIEALQLNREEVMNLRRILIACDEHPPKTTAENNTQ